VPPLRFEHRGWDTVAFYLNQKGDKAEAVKTLKGILEKNRNTRMPRCYSRK
jgi:DNA transposition AAA+ family ATPase